MRAPARRRGGEGGQGELRPAFRRGVEGLRRGRAGFRRRRGRGRRRPQRGRERASSARCSPAPSPAGTPPAAERERGEGGARAGGHGRSGRRRAAGSRSGRPARGHGRSRRRSSRWRPVHGLAGASGLLLPLHSTRVTRAANGRRDACAAGRKRRPRRRRRPAGRRSARRSRTGGTGGRTRRTGRSRGGASSALQLPRTLRWPSARRRQGTPWPSPRSC